MKNTAHNTHTVATQITNDLESIAGLDGSQHLARTAFNILEALLDEGTTQGVMDCVEQFIREVDEFLLTHPITQHERVESIRYCADKVINSPTLQAVLKSYLTAYDTLPTDAAYTALCDCAVSTLAMEAYRRT